MLWFWIDLFFPFFSIHVLLTVDLYIPRRRSMRDVRMIIILSRPTKLRPDSAWAVGVANPTQTLRGLVEIKVHGTLNSRCSFLVPYTRVCMRKKQRL